MLREMGLSLVLIAGVLVMPAAAATQTVTLPVTDVIVYEDRALVNRSGAVQIAKGASRVVLDGLPSILEEASVRAALEGSGGARVVSVSSRTEERAEVLSEKVRAAQGEVERLEREVARLRAEDGAMEKETEKIAGMQEMAKVAVSEGTALGQLDAASIGRIADFFTQRLEGVQAAQRGVRRTLERVQEELGDARSNLSKLSARQAHAVRIVSVDLESPEVVDARLQVSYIVTGCGWSPHYEARLTGGRLRLTYQGDIRQKTGEDWASVRVALSTAHPALGAKRPALGPLRMATTEVGPVKKTVATRYEQAPAAPQESIDVEDAHAVASDAVASDAIASDVVPAVVAETGTSVSFLVPERADIPADGRSHKVAITAFEDPSPHLAFETVPKLMRYIFLRCDSSNATTFPMLAGPVDVWRESGFIGTSSTVFVAPRGTFSLSFGIDEDLKVRRIEDATRTKDAIAGSRREHRYAYDIEVSNYRKDATQVTVKENIPVSDVEEVVVTLDPATTPPSASSDKEKGLYSWTLTLAPGEKKQIRLEYMVRMPKDFAWNE